MCTKICCCKSKSTKEENDEKTEPLLTKKYGSVNDLLFDADLNDIETASCASLSKDDQILFDDLDDDVVDL